MNEEQNEQQQMFNKVCEGFAAQGGPSFGADGSCCYFLGCRRCAIGLLMTREEAIAAEQYSRKTGEGTVLALFSDGVLPERFCHHQEFLTWIQLAHDKSKPGHLLAWADRMAVIAQNYSLDPAAIKLVLKWDGVAVDAAVWENPLR